MKTINFFMLIGIVTIFSNKVSAQCPDPVNDVNWYSIFSDDFNYTSLGGFRVDGLLRSVKPWSAFLWGSYSTLNSTDVAYESDYNRDNCHNMEFHGSTAPGYLTLTIKHESPAYAGIEHDSTDTSPGQWAKPFVNRNFNYSKGVLNLPPTSGFRYGYIEMSFRLPDWSSACSGSTDIMGLSADLWMFNAGGAITHSEIDIMENFDGYNNQTDNVHFVDTIGHDFHLNNGINTSLSFSGSFHLLSCEWSPAYIKFYVDHQLVGTNTQYCDQLLPMGLILDLGVNAYETSSPTYVINSCTAFPYKYDIDYINVWQLNMDSCSGSPTVLNKIDAATYPQGVKKSIEITGNANTDITSGQNVTLRASDYVKIDKNFKVELGATFSIIPTPCQ